MAEEESKKVADSEKKAAEYLAGWQRERADFLNYKKDELVRIDELMHYAVEGLVLRVLPILDNLYLAEEKLPQDLKNNPNVEGLLMVKRQILDFLKSQGVEEIELKEEFDPQFHEVVGQSDKFEQVQKGYKINGNLLRPAKVKVVK